MKALEDYRRYVAACEPCTGEYDPVAAEAWWALTWWLRAWVRLVGWVQQVSGANRRRARQPVALIHSQRADGVIVTQQMSGWYLDVEIHDGQLVLTNIYEQLRVPVDELMTLEIRP